MRNVPKHSFGDGRSPGSGKNGGDRTADVGTYVNGRRLPLQGRGWGFESLRAYQVFVFDKLQFLVF
jgi:hypothetical protein